MQRLLRAFPLSIVGAVALRGASRRLGAARVLFPGPQEKRFVWQGPRISMVSTQIFGNDYSDFRYRLLRFSVTITQILGATYSDFPGPIAPKKRQALGQGEVGSTLFVGRAT